MADIESIMRKIHVLFAKCESYGEEKNNMIIVPKKEVFRLLEELNMEISAMMDRYEVTAESRERGMSEYRRQSEKILQRAKNGADDVYAASLIFTDNMIYELTDMLDAARQGIRDEYAAFAKKIAEQEKQLEENHAELKEQLSAMASGEKYLHILERENARREHVRAMREAFEKEEDEEAEKADEEETEEIDDLEQAEAENAGMEDSEPGELSLDAAQNEMAATASGTETATKNPESHTKKELKSGKSGRSKRKTNSKGNLKSNKKPAPADASDDIWDFEEEWESEKGEKKVRNIGSALFEDVGKGFDDAPKKVSYEIHVNQAYFDQQTSSEDLDAEYYRWMEEKEGKPISENTLEESAAAKENREKKTTKNRHKRFGRKNDRK